MTVFVHLTPDGERNKGDDPRAIGPVKRNPVSGPDARSPIAGSDQNQFHLPAATPSVRSKGDRPGHSWHGSVVRGNERIFPAEPFNTLYLRIG